MRDFGRRLFGAWRTNELGQKPRRAVGHRRLQRVPQAAAHRGWLAQHGGHPRLAPRAEPAAGERPVVPPLPLVVVADHDVEPAARQDAVAAVNHVGQFSPYPVLHARVSLERQHDPAVERPAVVRAALQLRGRVVRAHATARTFADAVDILERRLRRRLENVGELPRSRRPQGRPAF